MTEEPKPESPEGDAEFERVLKNLVNSPPKPHGPLQRGENPHVPEQKVVKRS